MKQITSQEASSISERLEIHPLYKNKNFKAPATRLYSEKNN